MTTRYNGTKAKTMHGARARVYLGDPTAENLVGIFMDVSWSVQLENRPVETLGNFRATEIVTVGQSPVTISATGWRPVDPDDNVSRGPHIDAGVPRLNELLGLGELTMTIYDRQTGKTILHATGLKSGGYRTRLSVRGLQEISVDYIGLAAEDESGSGNAAEGIAEAMKNENPGL